MVPELEYPSMASDLGAARVGGHDLTRRVSWLSVNHTSTHSEVNVKVLADLSIDVEVTGSGYITVVLHNLEQGRTISSGSNGS
jgi:hypothetical protein